MPVYELAEPRDESNPLRHLQELYAVVVGVALVLAAEELVDPAREGVPLHGDVLLLFLAFVVIAFPTYHARGRYLDLAYARGHVALDRSRVFADLLLGMSEFVLLIGLALLVSRPLYFSYTVLLLLAAGVARALIVRGVVGVEHVSRYERTMLPTGVAVLAVFAAVVFVGAVLLDGSASDAFLRVALLALGLGRALAYYVIGYEFFFGASEDGAAGSAQR
jgi:hypothetical protein